MTSKNHTKPLAGEGPFSKKVERMIRVNHAGEYGAMRIYQGQIDALKDTVVEPALQHMLAQEQAHLEHFEREIVKRHVRPTALLPLWHAAGYALGYMTAKLGKEAAMACTVAVEEVIDEHYATQEISLKGTDEQELKTTIETFRQEELEHRDIGLENEAQKAPFYQILTQGIKAASKVAIWLSKRF